MAKLDLEALAHVFGQEASRNAEMIDRLLTEREIEKQMERERDEMIIQGVLDEMVKKGYLNELFEDVRWLDEATKKSEGHSSSL